MEKILLEDELKKLDPNTDVLIYLNSETYISAIGKSIKDCCGNHKVKNWLDAIQTGLLYNTFYVTSIDMILSTESTEQFYMTLDKSKDNYLVSRLDRLSNQCAIYNSLIDNTDNFEEPVK